MSERKWYLGRFKGTPDLPRNRVYLRDFSWDCGWYWGGGYIGNDSFHAHFDGAFLDRPDSRGHVLSNKYIFLDPWTEPPSYYRNLSPSERVLRVSNGASVWEPLSYFLDDAQYDANEWWRIKDLFKQFYALRDAAEVFRYGGHCTSTGRDPRELVPSNEALLNDHIRDVIIPLVRQALDKVPAPTVETPTQES